MLAQMGPRLPEYTWHERVREAPPEHLCWLPPTRPPLVRLPTMYPGSPGLHVGVGPLQRDPSRLPPRPRQFRSEVRVPAPHPTWGG